jgi:hypothetical protein
MAQAMDHRGWNGELANGKKGIIITNHHHHHRVKASSREEESECLGKDTRAPKRLVDQRTTQCMGFFSLTLSISSVTLGLILRFSSLLCFFGLSVCLSPVIFLFLLCLVLLSHTYSAGVFDENLHLLLLLLLLLK